MLVECLNALYGTMVASLLYYQKFMTSLKDDGFVMNPYDPCVWNKMLGEKQCTVCFHVNDCKISHVSSKVIDNIIDWLRCDYESIFENGSGEMKVHRGKVHKYLGMTLDFSTKKQVKISMIDYIKEIIDAWDKAAPTLTATVSKRLSLNAERKARTVPPQKTFFGLTRIQKSFCQFW